MTEDERVEIVEAAASLRWLAKRKTNTRAVADELEEMADRVEELFAAEFEAAE